MQNATEVSLSPEVSKKPTEEINQRSEKTISLRDRIVRAKTQSEVSTLLDEGSKYLYASDKTRRRWQEAANAVLKSI